MERKQTRQIHIGPVAVGGGAPVSVQSMTNTKTADVAATVAQIRALSAAGCDIVRLAVPDMDAAKALGEIIRGTDVPLVADIHFDYRLALEAIRLRRKQRAYRSASGSTAVLSIKSCSRNTAALRRKRLSNQRWSMFVFWKRRISMI